MSIGSWSLLVTLACWSLCVDGRVFSRCELVRELSRHGIPRSEMANYIREKKLDPTYMEEGNTLFKVIFSDCIGESSGKRVCLIEAESCRNTDAINPVNDDGSIDYGLFQINSRYWCNDGPRPGKGCNITCEELLSDNIATAVRCAQHIKRTSENGWGAWVGWVNKCRGRPLPDVSNCY